MMNNTMNMNIIPKEKFKLVNEGQRLSDKKFDDKPVGYFKDAWIRFRKNKGSIVAAIIILIIILFSIFAPMIISNHPNTFMDVYYAKKPSRNLTLSKIGLSEGTVTRTFSGAGLVRAIAIGVAVPCIDETIQRFVPDRVGALGDVLIDMAGGAVGMLVVSLWDCLARQRKL